MTIVRGVIRFDTKQVQAAKKGTLTQLRAKAHAYDPDAHQSRLTKAGMAKPGDLFWLGEPTVVYESRNPRNSFAELVFPADFESGMARRPDHISGSRHDIRTRHQTPDKLARAYSKRCLEVTDNRIERLQSITSADAEACGAILALRDGRPWYRMINDHHAEGATPSEAYLAGWKRLHRPASGDENPIVAVISFRLIEENADDYLAKLNADTGALRVADEAVGERAA